MMSTKIHWCDETINPVVGCSKISTGCENCYAEKMAKRLAYMGYHQYHNVVMFDDINEWKKGFVGWNNTTAFVSDELIKPYKWKKPRSIFISSMGDLFHDTVPYQAIDSIMRMVWENKRHTFIFLTKRPENMKQYFMGLTQQGTQHETARRLLNIKNYSQFDHGWHMHYLKGGSLPNLVIGTSIEDQHTANERIPVLLQIPARRCFASIEPMIGPVDLKAFLWRDMNDKIVPQCRYTRHLSSVILGGESGSYARPVHPDWVRLVRDQCKEAAIPFMFKQWGEWCPYSGGGFDDDCPEQTEYRTMEYENNQWRDVGYPLWCDFDNIDVEQCTRKVGTKKAENKLDGHRHLELCW